MVRRIMRDVLGFLLVLALALSSGCTGHREVGFRGGTMLGGGEPTNDMPEFGFTARFGLTEKQRLAVGLDVSFFDFEQPAKILGLEPAEEVDADGTLVKLSAWYEYAHKPEGSRLEWFGGGGLALGFVDIGDADGDLEGGGTWDVETDAGVEVIPFLQAGLRLDMGEHWILELGGRVNFHLADWDLEDKVSGRDDTIDDYTSAGVYLGINYKF